jgi:hypothetical protein
MRFAFFILCDCYQRALRDAVLTVVLLAIDVAACAVEQLIEAAAFAPGNASGRSRPRFITPDCRLLCREPCRLASGKLARANSLADALPLLSLAAIDSGRVRHRDYAQAKHDDNQ